MSKQVNFFAAAEDALTFHSWLTTNFPDMAIVVHDSARHSALGGGPQPIASELLGQETVCLVPAWAKMSLVTFPPDSLVSVDLCSSPILEYSPSAIEEDKECVKVGRVYWAFEGHIGREEKKQVNSIFKWIVSHTEPLPGYGSWRIYPHARHFRVLRQWVGDPMPNPLYTASPPGLPT